MEIYKDLQVTKDCNKIELNFLLHCQFFQYFLQRKFNQFMRLVEGAFADLVTLALRNEIAHHYFNHIYILATVIPGNLGHFSSLILDARKTYLSRDLE